MLLFRDCRLWLRHWTMHVCSCLHLLLCFVPKFMPVHLLSGWSQTHIKRLHAPQQAVARLVMKNQESWPHQPHSQRTSLAAPSDMAPPQTSLCHIVVSSWKCPSLPFWFATAMAAITRLNRIWWCITIWFAGKFKVYKSFVTSILFCGC